MRVMFAGFPELTCLGQKRRFGGDTDAEEMLKSEELFQTYETAVVVCRDPSRGCWLEPGQICRKRESSAVVITAFNPGRERPSAAENEAANGRVLSQLQSLPFEIWDADGRSRDGTWAEPGWLVWEIPTAEAINIARMHRQFAIYHYDERGVRSIVDCRLGVA